MRRFALQHSVLPHSALYCIQMHFRGAWQLSIYLASVRSVDQGFSGKRPRGRLKMSCKLVKHLVTSPLVQVEAEVCNILFMRGCAMVELSVKEVVGSRGEILLSGQVSQSAVLQQSSD